MTRQDLLDEIHRLTPNQRRQVLAMAKTIRTARDAGDTRPAEQIVAALVQPSRRPVMH